MHQSGSRRDSPERQNTNNVTPCLIYTFEFEVNLLELNPTYPKQPKTLGERIRKTRMDRGLTIKQAASLFGVLVNVIRDWELKNVQPAGVSVEMVREVLGVNVGEGYNNCRLSNDVSSER